MTHLLYFGLAVLAGYGTGVLLLTILKWLVDKLDR